MADFWKDIIKCPFCSNEYSFINVKSSAVKVESYDADLKPNYKGINPSLYGIVSCPKCKFSFLVKDKDTLLKNLNPSRTSKIHDYLDSIDEDDRFEINNSENKSVVFYEKQLVVSSEIYAIMEKPFEVARLLLRLAWSYREKKDDSKELKILIDVMKICERFFEKAVSDNDAIFSLFFKGYVNYRLGNKKQAIITLDKLVSKYKNSRNQYIKAAKTIRGEIK